MSKSIKLDGDTFYLRRFDDGEEGWVHTERLTLWERIKKHGLKARIF